MKSKLFLFQSLLSPLSKVSHSKPISSDDRFPYVTNRDGRTNDITVLEIGKDSQFKQIQQIETFRDNPHNSQITPNGKFLFVANQDSDQIVIFKHDEKPGKLSDTCKQINLCIPIFGWIGF